MIGDKTSTFQLVFDKDFFKKDERILYEGKQLIKHFFQNILKIYRDSQIKILTEPKKEFNGWIYTAKLLNHRYYIFGIRVWTKTFK